MADQPDVRDPTVERQAPGAQNATRALLIFLVVSAVLVYLLGYGR